MVLDIYIRLSTRDDGTSLYLSHGNDLPIINTLPCIDIDSKFDVLYFINVIDECIKFLDKHDSETIIIHLKEESISEKNNDMVSLILYDTILHDDSNKQYSDYFYINNNIPQLGNVRKKIVILARKEYNYENNKYFLYKFEKLNIPVSKHIGINIKVKDMGSCRNYPDDGSKCYPVLYNNLGNNNKYIIQDTYNLDGPDKWDFVHNTITGFVSYKNEKDNMIAPELKYTNLTIKIFLF